MAIKQLYHSSGYLTKELKPSFLITGSKVKWDNNESNLFIYATTNRDDSIDQGFASIIEKVALVDRYQSRGKQITITLGDNKVPSIEALKKKNIYLYTILFDQEDKWEKTNNKSNGLNNEYKTDQIITSNLLQTETISIGEFLKGKELIFNRRSDKTGETSDILRRWIT